MIILFILLLGLGQIGSSQPPLDLENPNFHFCFLEIKKCSGQRWVAAPNFPGSGQGPSLIKTS